MKKQLLALATCTLMLTSASLADGFTLTAPSMSGQISVAQEFDAFGCNGQNISPQLTWKNAPKGTKSFAITIYDPDAPTGSGWWHWLVFNIPKEQTHIAQNASAKAHLPKGSIESITDYAQYGFGGACPPKGDKAHTYITTVYALDIEHIELKKEANPALVGYMINAHTIKKSSVVAYYKR